MMSLRLAACGMFASVLAPAVAAELPPDVCTAAPAVTTARPSALESLPILYQNPSNPFLQELAIQGQIQLQYAYGSAPEGSYGSDDIPDECTWGDIEVRRFRLGLRGRLLKSLAFHSLFDIQPDITPGFYKATAEAYATFIASEAFKFSVGKAELKFTREQEISSREILPFERSQLVNQMYGGELTGAWVCGKDLPGGVFYELGAYGNDRRDEWSKFDGGAMILAKLGRNYTTSTPFDDARFAVHYLHNTDPGYAGSGCAASPPYSDSIAVSNELTNAPFGLTTELFWGDGVNGRSNVCGFTAMPTCFLTEKLQLVSTLQFAGSRKSDGITLPYRYEALAPDAGDHSGDLYLAAYAGANYYLHGHKAKLMSGVKYSHLEGTPSGSGFDSWAWLAGFRASF